MVVRTATQSDVERIVTMVGHLRAAIRGPIEICPKRTKETVLMLLASPHGVVFVTSDGFIAGMKGPTIISGEIVAHEMGWYAEGGRGLELLRAFEEWAGACRIRLSTGAWCSTPDRLKRHLMRRGYRPQETAWIR